MTSHDSIGSASPSRLFMRRRTDSSKIGAGTATPRSSSDHPRPRQQPRPRPPHVNKSLPLAAAQWHAGAGTLFRPRTGNAGSTGSSSAASSFTARSAAARGAQQDSHPHHPLSRSFHNDDHSPPQPQPPTRKDEDDLWQILSAANTRSAFSNQRASGGARSVVVGQAPASRVLFQRNRTRRETHNGDGDGGGDDDDEVRAHAAADLGACASDSYIPDTLYDGRGRGLGLTLAQPRTALEENTPPTTPPQRRGHLDTDSVVTDTPDGAATWARPGSERDAFSATSAGMSTQSAASSSKLDLFKPSDFAATSAAGVAVTGRKSSSASVSSASSAPSALRSDSSANATGNVDINDGGDGDNCDDDDAQVERTALFKRGPSPVPPASAATAMATSRPSSDLPAMPNTGENTATIPAAAAASPAATAATAPATAPLSSSSLFKRESFFVNGPSPVVAAPATTTKPTSASTSRLSAAAFGSPASRGAGGLSPSPVPFRSARSLAGGSGRHSRDGSGGGGGVGGNGLTDGRVDGRVDGSNQPTGSNNGNGNRGNPNHGNDNHANANHGNVDHGSANHGNLNHGNANHDKGTPIDNTAHAHTATAQTPSPDPERTPTADRLNNSRERFPDNNNNNTLDSVSMSPAVYDRERAAAAARAAHSRRLLALLSAYNAKLSDACSVITAASYAMDPTQRRRSVSLSLRPVECDGESEGGGAGEKSSTHDGNSTTRNIPFMTPIAPVRSGAPSMPNLRNNGAGAGAIRNKTKPSSSTSPSRASSPQTNLDRAQLPSPILASLRALCGDENSHNGGNHKSNGNGRNDDKHNNNRKAADADADADAAPPPTIESLTSSSFSQRSALLYPLLRHLVHTVFLNEVTSVLCYGSSAGEAVGRAGMRLIEDLRKANGEQAEQGAGELRADAALTRCVSLLSAPPPRRQSHSRSWRH